MKYKFLEHTADAKFQAFGKNLEEAFSNAALATFSVMTDCNKINPAIEKNIMVEGNDLHSLLYNFLEELLFLLDSEQFLLNKVKKLSINMIGGKYLLKAVLNGDTKQDKYETKGEVKAVTYNEMEIMDKSNKAMVQVVLDL